MKLKRINGTNAQELEISQGKVLISYSTPVAAFLAGSGWYRTGERHSSTTTKHINKWLRANNVLDLAKEEPQSFFDNLLVGNPMS